MVAPPNTEADIKKITEGISQLEIKESMTTQGKTMDVELAKFIGQAVADGIKAGLSAREDNRHPKPYRGDPKDAEALFVYLFEVEQFGAKRGYNLDSSEMTQYAVRYLAGSALLWYNMSLLELENQEWSTFKETLKNQFLPATFEEDQVTKLMNMKQRTSVRVYAEEFTRISRYIPTYWKDEKILKMLFCRGLKPEVRVSVDEYAGELGVTIGEVITRAQRVDSIVYNAAKPLFNHGRGNHLGSNANTGSSDRDADGDTVMDLAAMTPKKMTGKERQYLIQNQGCFACRKLGHRSYECPYKQAFQKKSSDAGKGFLN